MGASAWGKREFIYGVAPCLAAITARRRTLYKVILNAKLIGKLPQREAYKSIIENANRMGCTVQYKHHTVFDRLVGRETPHQNVMMQVRPLQIETLDVSEIESADCKKAKPVWLMLDEIQDPMNLGAILRSAVYFGVDKVITAKKNCCRLSPAVSKASAGALEWLPIYDVDMDAILERFSSMEWDIVGTVSADDELEGSKGNICTINNFTVEKPTVLVLGNEGHGIRPEILAHCTKLLTILPHGSKELPSGLDSLNVSVATGILLNAILCRS